MKPIKFKQANLKLLPPSGMTPEECGELYVYSTGEECISCWKMDFAARIKALLFGKVWLSVKGQNTQPPVWLSCQRDIFDMRKLDKRMRDTIKSMFENEPKEKAAHAGAWRLNLLWAISNWWWLIVALAVIALVMLLPQRAARADEAEPDDRFTIVWIADTQAIAYYDYDGAFEKMGAWIMDNQGPADIRYIVQTGDAVDNGYHGWQWRNYYKLYDQFAGEIPYIAVAGNHELGVKRQEWDAYLALPEVKAIPEQNKFEGGKAVYSTFTYGDEKFIIVGAGYGATEEAAPWMRQVLEDHADYTAILIFHSYLRNADEYMNAGVQLFEDVVKACQNVRLVLSGHVSKGGNAFRQEEIDDDGDGKADRTVTAMMYNYQSWSMNCGQLRTLEFDTGDRSITVHTFSPVTGKEFKDVTFKTATFTIQDAF